MIEIIAIRNLPLIKKGDDIATMTLTELTKQGLEFRDRDVLVVAQKIVSKAEGRVINLREITPSKFAERIARSCERDPRHVEAILNESGRIVRMQGAHLIVETTHGFVCANAGVDRSNVENEDCVVALPINADESARKIRARIRESTGSDVAVIIADTFGRAWRIGQVNVAIGVDGLKPIIDYRGSEDMFGRTLNVTQIAIADELASAAELVMKKSDGTPVALIRGVDYAIGKGSARQLIRAPEEDLFR